MEIVDEPSTVCRACGRTIRLKLGKLVPHDTTDYSGLCCPGSRKLRKDET